jgi:hypothetical protein
MTLVILLVGAVWYGIYPTEPRDDCAQMAHTIDAANQMAVQERASAGIPESPERQAHDDTFDLSLQHAMGCK